jgi:RHS repeat-associated protein
MIMPNRNGTQGTGDSYRYGFNGMEADDEIKGTKNSYDFGARLYDPRVGRFMCTDPLESSFSSQSPYITSCNNPIYCIDEDGESGEGYVKRNRKGEVTKIKVVSNIYLYGEVTGKMKRAIRKELRTEYNNYEGSNFEHNGANVKFTFGVRKIKEDKVDRRILKDLDKNNIKNNYWYVSSGKGGSYTINYSDGGNTGYISIEDFNKGINSEAHEYNHSIGGDNHGAANADIPINITDVVRIAIPQQKGVVMENRHVTQKDIDATFSKVDTKTDKSKRGKTRFELGNITGDKATGNYSKVKVK